MLRILVAALIALALPLTARGATVVESVRGAAEAGGAPLVQGQRLEPSTAISTGPGAQVFLKFDDGMQIVLHENSLLRMIDFRHTPSGVTDRAVFELLRGAARVVTGMVAKSNPKQFFFRTPQTQLTVERPADFTVALVNPAYVTVTSGTVLSSNGWGTVSLNAGSTSAIAGNASAPASIAASSMPPSAAAATSSLSLASVSAPAGGVAAGSAPAAVGGPAFGTPLVLIGGAVAAAAVLAGGNGGDDAASPTATPSHH